MRVKTQSSKFHGLIRTGREGVLSPHAHIKERHLSMVRRIWKGCVTPALLL
jgi:hypothetical protein